MAKKAPTRKSPTGADTRTVITDMRAAALKLATELRTRASDIERAANTIAAIARDDSRSERIDGPSWDRDAKVLSDAGIHVPPSWHYTWTT